MLNRIRLNENCTCCESGEEQSQRMRSKEIDRELHTAKRRMRATQKIALLGAGESGKSTFLKQMQIIHGNGFTEDEIIAYRTQIYENIMRGMAGLVNGKRELNLPWRGSFSTLKHVENGEDENSVSHRMKGVLNQYNVTYKQLMEVREKESVRLNRRLDIKPEQFCKNGFVDLILAIWNDHSIREAYDRRREFPKYFVENIPYFIENIDRIGSRVKRTDFSF
jgi:guanine nucleotide-binding protein subunit alpha-13